MEGNVEKEEPRLLSVQVGKPRTLDFEGLEWRSAIYKEPVEARLFLDRRNLEGDKQANTRYHGGPDKAVCCFPAEHYPFWREALCQTEETFRYGAFGENFTLAGLTEEHACIGDIYAVGTARVQITQPRQPCINLARKWNTPELPARMIDLGHSGFYLRVLQAGEVGAGDALLLIERPHPEITVAVANNAKYRREGGLARAKFLAAMPEFSASWRRSFRTRRS